MIRWHGAFILYLLREGTANDWGTLCRAHGLDPNDRSTIHNALFTKLVALREVGFVDFAGDNPWYFGITGFITLDNRWNRVQSTLGVSLTDIAKLGPDTMVVEPLLGKPRPLTNGPDVFVIMPFKDELRPIYDVHITNVTKNLGLTVKRADDFFTARAIMSDIWAATNAARLVIAECTGRNPNVFYEMGLAHVVGKPVVLITQDGQDVPSDVKHLRYIKYENTTPGLMQFERHLENTLRTELDL